MRLELSRNVLGICSCFLTVSQFCLRNEALTNQGCLTSRKPPKLSHQTTEVSPTGGCRCTLAAAQYVLSNLARQVSNDTLF
jgi:hypothetical protein